MSSESNGTVGGVVVFMGTARVAESVALCDCVEVIPTFNLYSNCICER